MEKQTCAELHDKIKHSSNRKILRRQVELLAEYSRMKIGVDRIPEASYAMARLYSELVKAEHRSILFKAALFGIFFCFLYGLKSRKAKCLNPEKVMQRNAYH